MGALTATSLWNMVSAFQVSDHCFSLSIKELSETVLVSVPSKSLLHVFATVVAKLVEEFFV